MPIAPKPVKLTTVSAAAYEGYGDPQPLVVVDSGTAAGEAGLVTTQPAIANQGALTVTDIATAQTAITALVSKINAILAALRSAGALAP
jgi:hypothetical protein